MNENALHARIELFEGQGRYDEIVKLITDNVDLSRADSHLVYILAFAHLQIEEYQKCEYLVRLALRENPDDDHFWYLYSLLESEQENFKEARSHIDEALRIDPLSPLYLHTLASLYLNINKLKKAEATITEGRKLAPDYIGFYINLVHLEGMRPDLPKAFEYAEQGLKIDPNNQALLSFRSDLMTKIPGKADQAEDAALGALRLDPHDEYARETLLLVLKNRNVIYRFFFGKSFQQYKIRWTVWRVILLILLLKGTVIWGWIFSAYVLVTWYGGVLFNTVMRYHKKYNVLLTPSKIQQSNSFLIGNGALLLVILGINFNWFPEGYNFGSFMLVFSALMLSICYFELQTKKGKQIFLIFAILFTGLLSYAASDGFALGITATLGLFIFAVMYTLAIGLR